MASVEAYRGLVERLEREARQAPGRYKFKLALLAGLGFAVLGGAVALALGVSVGLVVALVAISPILLLKLIKVVWIPIAFGWLILKALWVKFEPPEGYALRPGEAPELRAEIEHLRTATGAPPLRGIIIDPQLNAAAASVPRFMGLLGHTHYLVLGLPLMQLLNREQFAAVVAHEFGHFGGGHGKFAGWIYRVRASWYRLLGALSLQRGWTTRLFTRFFDWYAPYFNAYSFVLARSNEYEADAAAARLVGSDVAGQALVRINLGSEQLDREFWPRLRRGPQSEPQPPVAMYRDLAASFARPGEDEAGRLQHLLAAKPDLEDTHPTLAQRLQALGVAPDVVPPSSRTAADSLLGALQDSLQVHFSEQWRSNVDEHWQQRHQQYADDRARLAALEAQPTRSDEEAIEHARLVEDLRPEEDPVPLYTAALARLPEHPLGQFRLGALLLARDEAAGIGHLQNAIDLDPDAEDEGLQLMDAYYQRQGDGRGRETILKRQRALHERRVGAFHDRQELAAGDRFLPHGLDTQALAVAVEALHRAGNVKQAWIARKVIKGDTGGMPHFAVLVRWRGVVLSESSALQKVVDALELPGSFIVFTAGNQRRVANRVKKAAGRPVLG